VQEDDDMDIHNPYVAECWSTSEFELEDLRVFMVLIPE